MSGTSIVSVALLLTQNAIEHFELSDQSMMLAFHSFMHLALFKVCHGLPVMLVDARVVMSWSFVSGLAFGDHSLVQIQRGFMVIDCVGMLPQSLAMARDGLLQRLDRCPHRLVFLLPSHKVASPSTVFQLPIPMIRMHC